MDTSNINMQLKCGYINIQSVGNKTAEIRELIVDKHFDIFAIAETWLNEQDLSKITEMTPATHTLFHRLRRDRRGGGVGLLVSDAFTCVRMKQGNDPQNFNSHD